MTFEPDTEFTPVIFRTDKDGEVTAVFPTQPGGRIGDGTFLCYAHVGQHGGCSLGWYQTTRPAKASEYADLKRELESAPYGYRLKVAQRMTKEHRAAYDAASAAYVKGA